MNLRQRSIVVRTLFTIAAGCAAWLIIGFAASSYTSGTPERIETVRPLPPFDPNARREPDWTRTVPGTPASIDLSGGLEWVFDSDQRWALIGAPLAFIVGLYLRAGED